MKRLLICALALLVAGPLLADEKEQKKNPPKKEKGRKQEDQRTSMRLPIRGLSEKNQQRVCDALKKMGAIDEATPDVKKKDVEVKFASAASTGIGALVKGLKGSGGALDLARLKLKYPCTVRLGGPMSGAKWDRKMGKRSGFNSLPGQRLLRELKAIEGVRYAAYPDETSIKLGMDREISYTTIAALIARHGSRSKGSGVIKDVTWTAEKVDAKQGKQRRKK